MQAVCHKKNFYDNFIQPVNVREIELEIKIKDFEMFHERINRIHKNKTLMYYIHQLSRDRN